MPDQDESWYFSLDGRSKSGPATREELLSAIRANDEGEILVWREGLEGWVRATEVAELRSARKGIPPPLPNADRKSDDNARSPADPPTRQRRRRICPSCGTIHFISRERCRCGESLAEGSRTGKAGSDDNSSALKYSADLHPWRRFFARFVDVFLFGVAGWGSVGILMREASPGAKEAFANIAGNQVVSSMVTVGAWALVESILLVALGTTPGKRLFGIEVSSRNGQPLGFEVALQRSFGVWFWGLGCGFQLAAPFTQFFAYRRLLRFGATRWDDLGDVLVRHNKWTALRTVFVFCVVVGVVIAYTMIQASTAGR